MVCIVKQFYTLKEIYMPMISFSFLNNTKGKLSRMLGSWYVKYYALT